MIRRLRPRRLPLTVDEYVRRATLALPRAERVEAAAELRSHLLERVSEYGERGYSREEAEFLAVRAMGEPGEAHPGLWRGRLRGAGWVTLALLCVGGLGWTAYREWWPPREGVNFELPQSSDTQRLFSMPDAPRGSYQAATLTLPKGTKTLVYVNVASTEIKNGNDAVFVSAKDIFDETVQNITGAVPGSYRPQERWLWTTQSLVCEGRPRARLWVTAQTLPSPFWNTGVASLSGLGSITEDCDNPSVALARRDSSAPPPGKESAVVPPDGQGVVAMGRTALALDEWTVLARLVVDPEQDPDTAQVPPRGDYGPQARGTYIAVLPMSRSLKEAGDGSYSSGGGFVQLNGDDQPLPRLPSVVPGEGTRP